MRVETPSRATKRGGSELYGTCGRGLKTRRRRQESAREDPTPCPSRRGAPAPPERTECRGRVGEEGPAGAASRARMPQPTPSARPPVRPGASAAPQPIDPAII